MQNINILWQVLFIFEKYSILLDLRKCFTFLYENHVNNLALVQNPSFLSLRYTSYRLFSKGKIEINIF